MNGHKGEGEGVVYWKSKGPFVNPVKGDICLATIK